MSTELLIGDEPRRKQGGIWAYVSPSRLSKWLSCPLAYKLAYIDGYRPPTNANLFLGKAVHAGLQVAYRHRHLGVTLEPADVSRRMLESWAMLVDEENMKFSSTADEQTIQRQATDLVTAYLNVVPKDEKPLGVEVSVEMPLIDPATGKNLGIPMLGIMDLILDGQDGPVIADFKTSSRSSEPLDIVHEIQLTSYSYLFRQVSDRTKPGWRSVR